MDTTRESQRLADRDPQDPIAQARAEASLKRIGIRAMWGGEDITGKRIYLEGAVYHYVGKVESITGGILWLTESDKVFNNSETEIKEKIKLGRFSIPVSTIMGLGLAGEVNWLPLNAEEIAEQAELKAQEIAERAALNAEESELRLQGHLLP